MRRTVVCLLLVAPSVVAAPAPLPKADRYSDRDRVRGKWEVYSEVFGVCLNIKENTAVFPLTVARESHVATFTGDRLLWRVRGEVVGEDAVRLDRGRIDLTDVRSGQTRRGRYKVEGDTLTICVSPAGEADRPASFSPERALERVYVLRRRRK